MHIELKYNRKIYYGYFLLLLNARGAEIMLLDKNINKNIELIKDIIPIKDSFDIIGRQLSIGNKTGYLTFIDGFAKDDIMLFIMRDLQSIQGEIKISSVSDFIKERIPYIEAETFNDLNKMKNSVLSGAVALVIDGENTGIIIDAREYPSRSPEESQVEKVTRGSRDGFVETLIFNTALIRRRVRDPNLIFEIKNVGKRSQTDVVIGYIEDLVDKNLLDHLKEKIDSIDIPSLLMAEKSLEELIIKKKWYNPLPQVKFTERPDVVSAHLMEGHIAVIVDTSPSVMILPTTIFYFSQYAEDYYQNPLIGTFTRFVRFLAIITALFLTPVWLILAENSDKLPHIFNFIGQKEEVGFSLLVQFLILEFGIELLKLSSLHTPTNIGASFGIIGGLIVGELAIKVGFFSVETIFYTAVTAIAAYCIPSIEFSSSIRIFRLILLILSGTLGIWGFIAGIIMVFLIIYNTETFDNKRKYTWPLIPFEWKSLKNIIFRRPIIDIKRKEK